MARLAHAVKICLLLFVASAAYSGWQREQPGAADGDASPSPPTLRAGRKRLLSGLFSGGASHDEEAPARVLDAAEVVVAGVSVGAVDNTTCDYVHDLTTMEEKCNFVSQANNPCPDAVNLVNYLTLFYCSSTTAHTFVVLFLILVLLMFVSLLATTADYFFVPPLEYLSEYLKLSPDVAGITLLALGNGAPDVFTAFAAVNTASDFQLTLGGLLGASVCISSFVLASVLLASKARVEVDKEAFLRDVIVYLIATGTIFFVARDGLISIYESAAFLIIYVLYVAVVVIRSYIVNSRAKRKDTDHGHSSMGLTVAGADDDDSYSRLIDHHGDSYGSTGSRGGAVRDSTTAGSTMEAHRRMSMVSNTGEFDEEHYPIIGLSWSLTKVEGAGSGIRTHISRIQFFVEYPFSILRHLSTMPCDGHWDGRRRFFACVSPLGFVMVLLLDAQGLDGFTEPVTSDSDVPLVVVLGGVGIVLGLIMAYLTREPVAPGELPGVQPLLQFGAFASSVVWMDVLANEAVALMESLGIMFSISTAILGLTVIAIGNSVGDFVADTAVARAGDAKMSVATCFGSPLFNDIVGLGCALTVATARTYPQPFEAKLSGKLYCAWAFLATALLSSLFVFPATNYSPPRWFSIPLYLCYLGFLVVQVLDVVHVIHL